MRLVYFILYVKEKIFSKKSYAQHEEDIVLNMLLGRIEKFIDIGANNGISCSNTFLFALKGASGLCFEPSTKIFQKLRGIYLFNSKIKCLALALSDCIDTVLFRENGLLSSVVETEDEGCKLLLDKYINKDAEKREVETTTLETILTEQSDFRNTDFISIDVEGHELSVLRGINFDGTRTKCFVIETHGESSEHKWRHRDYDSINDLLQSKGYIPVLRSINNTFWLSENLIDEGRIKSVAEKLEGYKML